MNMQKCICGELLTHDTGNEYKCSDRMCSIDKLIVLDHMHYEHCDDDYFCSDDFERDYNKTFIESLDAKDNANFCEYCYYTSSQYREEYALNFHGNKEINKLDTINDLIDNDKLYIMDKETMVPFKASSAILYKDGILIANEQ